MILLATYSILLSKYSGQEDVIVGTPIAGRTHADLEALLGMFVNTLAMRNYPASEKTFEEFLSEVKKNALQAYENQDYPFEELVEKLNIPRDRSRNPLFDTMFVLENLGAEAQEDNTSSIAPDYQQTIAKFDLLLGISVGKGQMSGAFQYCTRLFKKSMIDRLAKDYVQVLEDISQEPSKKLKDINLQPVSKSKSLAKSVEFVF